MTWDETFLALFDRCVSIYRSGNQNYTTYFHGDEMSFLTQIGCKPREFFDFVEDYCEDGRPSPGTALLVAAVRRDYFIEIQNSEPSRAKLLTRDDLPTFGESLRGFAYLPRILQKARAKLRGELDPDLMYGCGGDRNFLRKHGDIHPADFLRKVWAAGDDDAAVADWIERRMK